MTKNKVKAAARLKKVGVNRPQITQPPKARAAPELNLSECAHDYAHVLLDPCGAPPACMPSQSAMRSRKMKVWARGSGQTGSNGTGALVVCPGQGVANNNPVSSFTWVTFSNSSSYVSTTVPSPATTGTGNAGSNSEYVYTEFGDGGQLQYRLVSLCARLRNTTQIMNRAGSVYALIEPDHGDLSGNTLSDLTAYDSCTNSDLANGEWHELLYTGPVEPDEMDYQSNPNYPSSFAYPAYNTACMAFYIVCQGSNVQSFDWEVWGNYEVVGRIVRGKTESFADPVGLNVITNGVQSAAASGGQGGHGTADFARKAVSFIGAAAKKAITYVAPMVPGMVGTALGGPLGGAVSQVGFTMASRAIMGALTKSRPPPPRQLRIGL